MQLLKILKEQENTFETINNIDYGVFERYSILMLYSH